MTAGVAAAMVAMAVIIGYQSIQIEHCFSLIAELNAMVFEPWPGDNIAYDHRWNTLVDQYKSLGCPDIGVQVIVTETAP